MPFSLICEDQVCSYFESIQTNMHLRNILPHSYIRKETRQQFLACLYSFPADASLTFESYDVKLRFVLCGYFYKPFLTNELIY